MKPVSCATTEGLDDKPSSSSSVYQSTPRLCTKCHGEGRIAQAPSRKARLRHKRQFEREAERIAGTSSGQSSLPTQVPPLPRRWDPCPKCQQQSGLLWPNELEENHGKGKEIAINPVVSENFHVAIIGGGIGGLALATALQHRNISCQVYEKDTCFDQRSQGYGLTLQQARKALLALGIQDQCDKKHSMDCSADEILHFLGGHAVTSTKHVVHTTDGSVVGEWGLRKWGPKRQRDEEIISKIDDIHNITEMATTPPPRQSSNAHGNKASKRQNLHVPRQALRHALWQSLMESCKSGGLESTTSSPVSWGHKLMDVQAFDECCYAKGEDSQGTSKKMKLTFQVQTDADDTSESKSFATAEADLIVGCDGIRSCVRDILLPCTPNNGERGGHSIRTPLRYLDCIVILGICPLDLLDASIRNSSALLDGETVFQTADGTTRIYLMPFSNKNDQYMWQLSFPISEETAKQWSRKGSASLKEEALNKCLSWHQPIPEILQKTPVDLVSGYPVYDRAILDREDILMARNHTGKTVTLLGDACHPMSPFKGQGANQALLDALSLARSLHRIKFREEKSLSEALEVYESEMIERSSKKVKASSEAAQFLHSEVAIQCGDVTRGAAAAANLIEDQ